MIRTLILCVFFHEFKGLFDHNVGVFNYSVLLSLSLPSLTRGVYEMDGHENDLYICWHHSADIEEDNEHDGADGGADVLW